MRLSLRSRVLAVTLVLVAVGLSAAGVATYTFLRKSLVDRVDDQLAAAEGPAAHVLEELAQFGVSRAPPSALTPPGTWVAAFDRSGRHVVVNGHELAYMFFGGNHLSEPRVPSALFFQLLGPNDESFSTESRDGRISYRAVALPVRIGDVLPIVLVVAIPLTEMEATLHRLVLVEVAVALAVLLAVGLLSWWSVRLGLRPLDRMAETAGAIAAGDLSRRVEPEDDRTEVGRLGGALNTMLGRIETSFHEQQESEARLRRFVADASHELRTPLTSIRGYAELFRRGAAARPDDLARAMRRIEDEGERMGVLVDDLLLLARLDQGRPLERAPVDLSAVVRDAVDDLRVADPGRPVVAEVEGGVVIEADEMRLRQVVANLLDNVRRHTPVDAEATVRLRTAGASAVLEVRDTGPGMPAEEAARVFERFYRGDPSRSRESGGTGLGLSIAAAIVEAHGGRVAVASEPGIGTTFTVELPVSSPASPTPTEGGKLSGSPQQALDER